MRRHIRSLRLDLGADSDLYDSVWLQLSRGTTKWALAAIYIPPFASQETSNEIFTHLQARIQKCLDRGLALQVIGDLNAHIGGDAEGIPNNPQPAIRGHGGNLRLLVKELGGVIMNALPLCVGVTTRFPMGAQRGDPSVGIFVFSIFYMN